ncbi:NTP transferase domain-containing protein [Hellea sp.]|nr:NTP transferase domain-containing protein [Hellea sp.]
MNPTPKIAVILAGGKARRFGGRDKGEILINHERVIDIIYARLKPQSQRILISGAHDYNLGFEVVPDVQAAPGGPVGGIYSIWSVLKKDAAEGFFTVPVDGPNLPHDLTERLYSPSASTLAVDKTGRHPTYAWWRMIDLEKILTGLDFSKSISLNKLAELSAAQPVKWEGADNFLNINNLHDFKVFVKDA